MEEIPRSYLYFSKDQDGIPLSTLHSVIALGHAECKILKSRSHKSSVFSAIVWSSTSSQISHS